MVDKKTEIYTFKSLYVRGYHVYQKIWRPVIEECIVCRTGGGGGGGTLNVQVTGMIVENFF